MAFGHRILGRTGYLGTIKMKCLRIFHRIRPRDRRSKKAAFWVATFTLCAMVLTFNDLTLRMVSQYSTDPEMANSEYVIKADYINGRYPKAVKQEDEAPAELPLELPEEVDPSNDLLPDLAPSTLHYLWCGRRKFEFRHYLALKSAVRVIKPDKVYFHYDALPEMDREGYYHWFNQSMAEISHMVLHELNDTICPKKGAQRFLIVMGLLHKFGGIYTPEDAILVDFPVHLRSLSLVSGAYARSTTDYMEGLMVGKKMMFTKPETVEQLQVLMDLGREEHGGLKPCASEHGYARDTRGDIICVRVEREIYPKDIWAGKTRFSTLARVVMYGSRVIQPRYNIKSPIPRIAHYICLEDPFIRFTGYLSMLSAIYVAGFQKVYIHGPLRPQGIWWKRLETDERFVYVFREFPENEHGVPLSVPMATCITRIDILLKYGGVYQDHNVFWTQLIPTKLFGYEAVVSPDWHVHGGWPESINHGALMSKRNAQYLKYLRQIFQHFFRNDYWYNDHYLSYHVLELHPELALIEPHLQVKCLNHNCHPTWQEHYRSRIIQNKPGEDFIWQNETLSLHWVDNFPQLNPDMVKYTSGIVVDIARNILKNAGVNVMDV